MSGRCLDDFWIGNGITENMDNLEILHWSMQYLCMDCLYMRRGVSGIFGGIYPAVEICFSLVVEKRV